MATVPDGTVLGNRDYPTSDGKPIAETDYHRNLLGDLIATLKRFFENHEKVYVSGCLMLFYVRGNKRRYIAPDVFVVKGVPNANRFNYLVWEEGRAPQVVIELTASSTRHKDTVRKFRLYRDLLRVKEYFLFDPLDKYLQPRLQGYRLRQGGYRPVRAVEGRLPSRVLGLHLEAEDYQLRLYDPAAERRLPTTQEIIALATAGRWPQQLEAEQEHQRAEQERQRADRMAARLRELGIDPEA
jgi:Uma2 family endonuclease